MVGEVCGKKSLTRAIKYKASKSGSGSPRRLWGFRIVAVYFLYSYSLHETFIVPISLPLRNVIRPSLKITKSNTLQRGFEEE